MSDVRTYQKTLLRYDSDDVRVCMCMCVCVRERQRVRACMRAKEKVREGLDVNSANSSFGTRLEYL